MIEILPDEQITHTMDGSKFFLRPPDIDTLNMIRDKNTQVVTREEGGKQRKVNELGLVIDLIDALVTGWEKVVHPVTKLEVPCTPENKRLLPLVVMNELVNVWLDAVKAVTDRVNAETKNLSGSFV